MPIEFVTIAAALGSIRTDSVESRLSTFDRHQISGLGLKEFISFCSVSIRYLPWLDWGVA